MDPYPSLRPEQYAMSMSEGNSGPPTQPNSPIVFDDDSDSADREETFAELIPHDETACEAFHAAAQDIKCSGHLLHRRYVRARFVNCSASPFSEDGQDRKLVSGTRLEGRFIFRLKETLPKQVHEWCAGSSKTRDAASSSGVEFLLVPPREEFRNLSISGSHVKFLLSQDLYRLILEARHTVLIGSELKLRGFDRCVLKDGEIITIGRASYVLRYTDYYRSTEFVNELRRAFGEYDGQGNLRLNQYLLPRSIGTPTSIGQYQVSTTSFARGTFGSIKAAWKVDGSVYAVKQLKAGNRKEVDRHVEIMQRIRERVSTLGEHSFAPLTLGSHIYLIWSSAWSIWTPFSSSTSPWP